MRKNKKRQRPWVCIGSILKATEGGPSRACLKYRLEGIGLKVFFGHSPYIGHSAVYVQGDGRKVKSAHKIVME